MEQKKINLTESTKQKNLRLTKVRSEQSLASVIIKPEQSTLASTSSGPKNKIEQSIKGLERKPSFSQALIRPISSSLSASFMHIDTPNRFTPLGNIPEQFQNKSPTTFYKKKDYYKNMFILEPCMLISKYLDNPKKLADDFFFQENQQIPYFGTIPQKFYEQILVETNSIKFQENHGTDGKLDFIKVMIKRVITLDQWGEIPHTVRNFTKEQYPSSFNYWDYQRAWFLVFDKQNETKGVSWFFYFEDQFPIDLPYWFLEWWEKFGLEIAILPSYQQSLFKIWEENFKIPEEWIFVPTSFIYASMFKLTWIFQMKYLIKDRSIGNCDVPYLIKQYQIKGWSKTNYKFHNQSEIFNWFNDNPKYSINQTNVSSDPSGPSSSKFSETKASLQAQLAEAQSIQETQQILQKYINCMSDPMDVDTSQEPTSLLDA